MVRVFVTCLQCSFIVCLEIHVIFIHLCFHLTFVVHLVFIFYIWCEVEIVSFFCKNKHFQMHWLSSCFPGSQIPFNALLPFVVFIFMWLCFQILCSVQIISLFCRVPPPPPQLQCFIFWAMPASLDIWHILFFRRIFH